MVVNDGLHADGGGDVRLAGAGSADEHDVLGIVEELAAIAGVEVPREAGHRRPAGTRELYDVLEQARDFYEAQLRRHDARDKAVDYLKARDISGQVAKKFVGLTPKDQFATTGDHRLYHHAIDFDIRTRPCRPPYEEPLPPTVRSAGVEFPPGAAPGGRR